MVALQGVEIDDIRTNNVRIKPYFNPLTFTVRCIGHQENKRTKDETKQE